MASLWVDRWMDIFGTEPADKTSREVSVQEVLAYVITGTRPAWFKPYTPTANGQRWLQLLWSRAFNDDPASDVEWFVSEYELPVPMEWRPDIGLTYGCPDFCWATDDRVVIVELKTERGSYRKRQMAD